MDLLRGLFNPGPAIPREQKAEFDKLIAELIQIGKKEDFLSEHPGGLYNGQCHHIRTRAIGRRLNELGGLPLMETARDRVRRKLGVNLTSHLEYAWSDIGGWIP